MNAKGEKPMVVERGGDRPVGCIHLLQRKFLAMWIISFVETFILKCFKKLKKGIVQKKIVLPHR